MACMELRLIGHLTGLRMAASDLGVHHLVDLFGQVIVILVLAGIFRRLGWSLAAFLVTDSLLVMVLLLIRAEVTNFLLVRFTTCRLLRRVEEEPMGPMIVCVAGHIDLVPE